MIDSLQSRQQLPHNDYAEASLLGCLLQNAARFSLLDEVGLVSDDFYSRKHQIIFEAMLFVLQSGAETLDIVTAHDRLCSMGKEDAVGGLEYLAELANNAPVVDDAKVTEYARLVKNSSVHREFISVCEASAAQIYRDQTQFESILDTTSTALIKLADTSHQASVQHLKPIVISVINNLIERREQGGGSLLGLATGFPSVDKVSSGLKKGDMVVIAARPGMGKTSLALNIACRVAANNHPVLFFSLEMPAEQVSQRILAAETGVSMTKIVNASLSSAELSQFMSGIGRVEKLPIYIDDSTQLTIASLRAKTKALRANLQKAGERLELIVIDYIGLMQSTLRGEKRNAQIEEISRGIKLFAKDMEIPIIVLSQLNRQSEGRKESIPMLSDLRDSGAIEQDADMVAIINRSNDNGKSDITRAELHILKNRHGATRVVPLYFNPTTTLFSELETHHEA